MDRFPLMFLLALAIPVGTVATVTAQRQTREKATGSAIRRAVPKVTAADKVSPAPPVSSTQTSSATPVASGEELCGCESPIPEVLAIVNGVKLGLRDIDTPDGELEDQRRRAEAEVIAARQRELERQVHAKLFDAEAKKRGITTMKLLDEEVNAKVAQPTDAETQAFYDANRAQIQSEFKEVKEEIVAHLREQRQQEGAKAFADRLRAASQVEVPAGKVTPPATTAERVRVLATVNNQQITSGNVEDNLRPVIFNARESLYRSRMQALDAKINNTLLEQEAQKRQTTTQSLFASEVQAKVVKVSEADAQAFYNNNRQSINADFAQVKAQVMQHLQGQENEKAVAAYAERLRKAASVQTFLIAPEPPVYDIPVDDQPTKGNAAAKVTIIEFTDYQCPACAQTQPVIERLAKEYGDRVQLVVRDFPLRQHANAFKSAEAAEAAREQGKFWEYVSLLFGNQSALDSANLKEYATRVGLDRRKFDAALDSGKYAEKVQRDLQDGTRFGVNSTPTLFVNGRRIEDRSYEGVKSIIENALKDGAKGR
ncbi:MAG: thioredoxin domain-containing protein [Acidobacteriota bacterium]|nr:thioredoxin domain-containing protein [Acidobacteriota bacterium]